MVRRALIRNGLHGGVATRKPLLKKTKLTEQLKYGQRHKNRNSDKWKRVFWSDESKFELFATKQRQHVQRRSGDKLSKACL